MNKDIRFYDTCSLLIGGESLFNNDEKFIVSSITFQELERIKKILYSELIESSCIIDAF